MRQHVEQSIAFWEGELERRDWSLTVLNEQMIEQKYSNRKFRKEIMRGDADAATSTSAKTPVERSTYQTPAEKGPPQEMDEFPERTAGRKLSNVRQVLLGLPNKYATHWAESRLNTWLKHHSTGDVGRSTCSLAGYAAKCRRYPLL